MYKGNDAFGERVSSMFLEAPKKQQFQFHTEAQLNGFSRARASSVGWKLVLRYLKSLELDHLQGNAKGLLEDGVFVSFMGLRKWSMLICF